ncbi:MAG: CGGC domain-containing protein [Desulfobacterales bacterium]|nr:CGGC domain-containing protein [Desulfobacterales bacterium]
MNIGLIRCEKNEDRCPLTGCLTCWKETKEGFTNYDEVQLAGVFTCRCPGDNVGNLGKIMKAKGVQAIHFCTCSFSRKENGKWKLGQGFCENVDDLLKKVSNETGLPCVKGSAHLPEGYSVETF